MSILFAHVAPLFVAILVDDPARVPATLEAAFQMRAADVIRTARVEWSIRDDFPGEEPVNDARYFSTKAAGSTVLTTRYGSEDTVRDRLSMSGEIPIQLRIRSLVAADGVVFERRDGDCLAAMWPLEQAAKLDVLDVRRVGLDPYSIDGDPLARFQSASVRFREREEGGQIVVTAEVDGGAVQWRIDPARDHAITSTSVALRGRELMRTEIDHELVDGHWFPVRTAMYRLAAGDRPGGRASRVVEVHRVELNRPDHPATLGPADIGVDSGTWVNSGVKGRPGGFFDGRKVVSAEEYFQRISDGTLQRGERSQRLFDARRLEGAPPPWQSERAGEAAAWPESVINRVAPAFRNPLGDHETRWRAYVRRFIARHKLDDAQSRRANEVLKDCEERANRYLATRKTELDDLREALQRPSAPRDGDKSDLRNGLAERVDSLSKPIDEIFEGVLKPRLDGLLTTAQRERGK